MTDPWREYERRKQAWVVAHPSATPEQYEAFIAALAEELGL